MTINEDTKDTPDDGQSWKANGRVRLTSPQETHGVSGDRERQAKRIGVLAAMGFDPDMYRGALDRGDNDNNNGTVTSDVEWIIRQQGGQDENAVSTDAAASSETRDERNSGLRDDDKTKKNRPMVENAFLSEEFSDEEGRQTQQAETIKPNNVAYVGRNVVMLSVDEPVKLEKDTFSLMFLSPVRSRAFAFASFVFALEMVVLLLTLLNLLKDAPDFNGLKAPINNPPEVIAAQVCAMVVLVLLRTDCYVTLSNAMFLMDLEALSRDGYPKATRSKWILCHACRFSEGLVSILVSFVFIVQAYDVLELFKDFAAIQFVASLDNVAFIVAMNGLSGRVVKSTARYIANTEFMPVKNRRIKRSWVGCGTSALMFAMLLGGWAYILSTQESNYLLMSSACRRLDIKLGQESYDLSNLNRVSSPFPSDLANRTNTPLLLNPDNPSELFYAYFNGMYTADWEEIINNRPVYYDFQGRENAATAGKFWYCAKESTWVFTIAAFDDGVSRGECDQWLARSEKTEAFLLEDESISSEWTVWTGATTKTTFEIDCIDCTRYEGESGCNFNGECNPDGTCACREFGNGGEPWFGESCQAPPPCRPVDAFVLGETSEDYRQVAHYMPVLNMDGSRVLTYQRPVYWNKRNLDAKRQNFLLYTGSRWYATDWPIVDLCGTDASAPCGMAQFAQFFTSDFHAYWFDTLTTNTDYISVVTDSFTPVGLEWLSLGQGRTAGDFGTFGFTYEEGFAVHCFNSNCDQSGLCGTGGDCMNDSRYNLTIRSWCQCEAGWSGYFCQFSPEHPYAPEGHRETCNEYFCDYLEHQEGSGTNCSAYCAQTRAMKTCWNTPTVCTFDPKDQLRIGLST